MADHDRGPSREGDSVETGDLGRAIAAMRAGRPPQETTQRVAAGLGPLLGPAGPGGTSTPQVPPPPTTGMTAGGGASAVVAATHKTLLIALAAVVIGGGTWGAYHWRGHRTAPITTGDSGVETAAPNASTRSEPGVHDDPVAAASAPESVPKGMPPAEASSHPAAKPSASVPSEAQLLAGARRLMERDPAGAMRLLQQHAAIYPDGMLSQEREVLRIETKARLGQLDEARSSATDFLKDHPGTVYGNKIRESAFGDASTDHNSAR